MVCCFCLKAGSSLLSIKKEHLHSDCENHCRTHHTLCFSCIELYRPPLKTSQFNKLPTQTKHRLTSSTVPGHAIVTVHFPLQNLSFQIPVQIGNLQISSSGCQSEIRIVGTFNSNGLEVETSSFSFLPNTTHSSEPTRISTQTTSDFQLEVSSDSVQPPAERLLLSFPRNPTEPRTEEYKLMLLRWQVFFHRQFLAFILVTISIKPIKQMKKFALITPSKRIFIQMLSKNHCSSATHHNLSITELLTVSKAQQNWIRLTMNPLLFNVQI